MVRELRALVSRFGRAEVASRLGVHRSTVNRWLREGRVSERNAPRVNRLKSKLIRPKKQKPQPKIRKKQKPKVTRKPKRPRARDVIEEQRRELIAEFQLRRMQLDTRQRQRTNRLRDGRSTTGRDATFPIGRLVSESVIESVGEKLSDERMARGFPNWVAMAELIQYVPFTEGDIVGSVGKVFPGTEEDYIVVESILSSGKQSNRQAAIDELNDKLQQVLAREDLISFVNSIQLSTYEYKTDEERRDRETRLRKRRKRTER